MITLLQAESPLHCFTLTNVLDFRVALVDIFLGGATPRSLGMAIEQALKAKIEAGEGDAETKKALGDGYSVEKNFGEALTWYGGGGGRQPEAPTS